MVVVVEAHRHRVQLAGPLDKDVVGAVDHDVVDRVVLDQALDRAVTHQLVARIAHQGLGLALVDRQPLVDHEALDLVGDEALQLFRRPGVDVQIALVDLRDQVPVHVGLQRLVLVRQAETLDMLRIAHTRLSRP